MQGPKNSGQDSSEFLNSVVLPEGGCVLPQLLSLIELDLISQALNRCQGNKTRASYLLGINRTTLIGKLKKFLPVRRIRN